MPVRDQPILCSHDSAATMMNETPWYRQFWPWFLIAIPLLGVVLSTITAVNAIRGADPEVPQVQAPLSKTSWTDDVDADTEGGTSVE